MKIASHARSLILAASLLSAALAVSACRDHPGHDSDRHHHQDHDHDGH
jgi:hypothetical protein